MVDEEPPSGNVMAEVSYMFGTSCNMVACGKTEENMALKQGPNCSGSTSNFTLAKEVEFKSATKIT